MADARGGFWDPGLPSPPASWLEETTFALRAEEADYLEHRVNFVAGRSLLAHLICMEVDPGESSFVWDLLKPGDLPLHLAEELEHARNFSESMHGAALLYNLMLAEEKKSGEKTEECTSWIAKWWRDRQSRASAFHAWDRSRLWNMLREWQTRVTPSCRVFVDAWLDAIKKEVRPEGILRDRRTRDLIRHREQTLKGARARLGNARALDLWSGASGTAQLDYRWKRPVSGILKDLLLARGKGA